jgi:hypothetical protein
MQKGVSNKSSAPSGRALGGVTLGKAAAWMRKHFEWSELFGAEWERRSRALAPHLSAHRWSRPGVRSLRFWG